MNPVDLIVYTLIGINVVLSFMAFNNMSLFQKLKFHVGSIKQNKEYYRFISSAFLHGDLTHLLFNMIALYSFGLVMKYFIGPIEFTVLYFVSLLVGNALAYFYNKDNNAYSAVGASGAVSGVVFASILFYPFGDIIFIFLPFFPIPSWIFGILYLLYTVYGMNKQNDNIGHEAHLGGAVAGVVLAILFDFNAAMANWWLTLLLLAIPAIIFFINPNKRKSSSTFKIYNEDVKQTKRSVDDLYYNKEFEKEKELDALLDKVGKDGLGSLSYSERKRLDELSKELNR